MRREEMQMGFTFPKPGKTLRGMLIAVFAIWVLLAVAINWLGLSQAIVMPFIGDTSAVLHGQVWRLVTAPFIHAWTTPSHMLMTMLGLYFLGTPLEGRFTSRGLIAFLVGSAVFAFALQTLVGSVVPQLHAQTWYGGLGMVEAVAVAWALQFRGQQVRLFFVLPVSSTMLLGFIIVMSILNVLAQNAAPEGLVTPFGGMLAGWLFGTETSPLRAWWRARGKAPTSHRSPAKGRRPNAPGLRVLRGGSDDDDDEPPPDKRWLN